MSRFFLGPFFYKDLFLALARRDIVVRYHGTLLGVAWSFVTPLILLAIYTFVFGFIFKVRWNTGTTDSVGLAFSIYCGLLVLTLVTEVMNRAPTLLSANRNYVKKVVFPLPLLPWVVVSSAAFQTLLSLALLLIAAAIHFHGLPWSAALSVIMVIPILLFSLGLAYMFSCIGVFIPDISQISGVIAMILMFVTPIFYPIDVVPEPYRQVIALNPLAIIIEQLRGSLLWGHGVDWGAFGLGMAISVVWAILGAALFRKLERGFADVL